MYHQVWHSEILHFAHRICSCFVCSSNRQWLLLYSALTDRFFITEMVSVYCTMQTWHLNKTSYVSSLKVKGIILYLVLSPLLVLFTKPFHQITRNSICIWDFRFSCLTVRETRHSLRNPVGMYVCFGGTCCLHLQCWQYISDWLQSIAMLWRKLFRVSFSLCWKVRCDVLLHALNNVVMYVYTWLCVCKRDRTFDLNYYFLS